MSATERDPLPADDAFTGDRCAARRHGIRNALFFLASPWGIDFRAPSFRSSLVF
jgi:hypothetical protein